MALEPLTFSASLEVAQHTRHSSPGPGGIPHDAWAGLLVISKSYLAILGGAEVPAWLNASLLVVFIPETALGAPCMPHEAAPENFRPNPLSNTCRKLTAKAMNLTLETVAQDVVHSAQCGFVHGRRIGEGGHIILIPSAMERALFLREQLCVGGSGGAAPPSLGDQGGARPHSWSIGRRPPASRAPPFPRGSFEIRRGIRHVGVALRRAGPAPNYRATLPS